jgi:amino acid adenylation domain-containing protein
MFVQPAGKPAYQVTLKMREPLITWHDVRGQSDTAQAAHIQQYQEGDKARGFDLQKDVLLRIAVFQLGDTSFRLVWSYHHILFDGWSFGLLQTEFVTIYRALARGVEPILPPVPPYRQYVRWLQGQKKDTAVSFWRTYLSDYTQISTLPHLLPPSDNYQFDQQTWVLSEAETSQLQAICAQQGVTLSTLLRAVWAVLLARYNQREDVLFGAIVSGRPASLPGVEEIVGLFINAVPVRAQLQAGDTLITLAQRLQQEGFTSEPYHYLPLAEIQSVSPLGRELFDHLLIFENYPQGEAEAEAAEAEFVITQEGVHDRTHYDLDITLTPGRQMVVQFNYNTAVYLPSQIRLIIGHWQTVLAQLYANPHTPLAALEILPASERAQLLTEFNNSHRPYPTDVTVLELFAEQVRQNPERLAVVWGEVGLSYGEVHGRATQLARHLRQQGIQTGERIAICLNRTPDMLVAVLGIWQAGAAYVPLDADYPLARLAFMLADSAPSLLLTESNLLPLLPTHPRTLCLDSDWQSITQATGDLPPINPSSLAYLIYTSGSTGQAKGVMVNHANLTNAAFGWREVYALDQSPQRMLQMASLAFDVFAGDLLRALTSGGTLVICPAEVRVEPPALYALLRRERINLFETTPALALPLLEYVWAEQLALPDLHQLIIGSDTLPASNYRWLLTHFGHTMRIWNSYGVTEATIDSSLFAVSAPAELITQNTPIGRPLPNVQFLLLDGQGRLAPIGVDGELLIGGAGVAQGYWQREALTAEKFVSWGGQDAVFSEQYSVGSGATALLNTALLNTDTLNTDTLNTALLYKTGDFARWLPDGNVEFLGRRDEQVKVRGYRLELGEIESRLLGVEGVDTAVVIPKNDQLIAYLSGQTQETNDLRQQLRQTLPDFMLPNQFIWLESLPLTPNGKIDRKQLRERPDHQPDHASETITPPRTPTEEKLTAIWAEVLALPVAHLSVYANFFTLGGHSLKAMQAVSRIQQQVGQPISLRDFFNHATIAEQATHLDKQSQTATPIRQATPPSRPRQINPITPSPTRKNGSGWSINWTKRGHTTCPKRTASMMS